MIVQEAGKPKVLHAIKLISTERFDSRDFEILRSLRTKAERAGLQIATLALGSDALQLKADRINVYPWEYIA